MFLQVQEIASYEANTAKQFFFLLSNKLKLWNHHIELHLVKYKNKQNDFLFLSHAPRFCPFSNRNPLQVTHLVSYLTSHALEFLEVTHL